ncbi:hypothetical protein LPB140_04300 [Sphingorhabdus lutea]|uniref:WG repeat-containing protein n=1 Tax=Sphingorhabdus lutea TaxID=1913578 RepID=A0A1L3JAK3_9SPHN|nr:WG repeat-containing protein [Sphingorhabdus lutea]APG62156.1 hypothetical protein LPB140_04300 [Sphingorhabdus lutea]
MNLKLSAFGLFLINIALLGCVELSPSSKNMAVSNINKHAIITTAKMGEKCSIFNDDEFTEYPNCAFIQSDGSYIISSDLIEKLKFDSNGLAPLFFSGFAYARLDGYAIKVATMDNFADYFSDGLVRANILGRQGYADAELNMVIPAIYDGTYPFHNGRARVCIGCSLQHDGEHSFYAGGKDICLDIKGNDRPLHECR